MEREVENGLHALGIGLDHLPRFGVGQILVADAGEVHGLLLRIAEAELLEQALHFGLHTAEFFDRGAVGFGEFSALGHVAFVIFLRELEGAVHEVAVDGHQLVVVARLEVGPREVVVLRFGGIGREHVAQHVLFAGEVHEIFVEPHGPVARSGDLVVFEVEKFVRRHVVGEDIRAFCLEHGGENDAVEDDIVFADEVNEARVGAFPPRFPRVGEQLFGVGDVADGGVKPHIEHFAFGTLYGHGNTPVEVATHGAGFESHVEPALALSAHIGTPFGMLFDPRGKPLLMLVEGEIPVLGFAQYGLGSRDGAAGIDEFGGRKVLTAALALVAVGIGIAAVGAFAHDVAVSEEGLRLFVVVLLVGFLQKLAFVVEFAEEIGGHLAVGVAGGAGIDVEGDAEAFKTVFDELVVAVHHFLNTATFLAGTNGYGHTVLVRTADEEDIAVAEAEIAGIDVGGDVDTGEVADVHTAVGIGQGGGDEGSLEFIAHRWSVILGQSYNFPTKAVGVTIIIMRGVFDTGGRRAEHRWPTKDFGRSRKESGES